MDSPRAPRLEIHGRVLARNTLLNLAGQAAPLLVGVLCIPPVISGLGTERFGLLALAWAVLGYFNIFDLGLSRATTKFVAESLGRGEHQRLPRLVWTAALSQAGFGLIGSAILALATPALVEHILNIPPALTGEARLSFYLLSFSIPIVLVTTSLRGTLEAAQRFDLVNALRAPASAAVFFLPLAGLWLGWVLPGIVALLVAARAVVLVLHYVLCRRVFPELRGRPRLDASSLRTLLAFGGWVTVSSAVGPILTYLDRFMLGVLATLGSVAFYSAPYEMVARLWVLPASLMATLFPAFSTLDAERQRREALAARAVKFILVLLGPVVVAVLALAPDVLRLWLGPEFALQSTRALQILAAGVLINSLAWVPSALLHASGRPDLPAKFHMLELPLQAALVWWLVSSFHITGAALAWSLRVAFDASLLFAACSRLSLLSWRSLAAHRLPQTALFTIVAGGGTLALGLSSAPVWFRASVATLVALALLIASWRFLLNEADRSHILGVLQLSSGRGRG
ncbi:MAG: flippase [Candidatus Acidiferrales bacterium]